MERIVSGVGVLDKSILILDVIAESGPCTLAEIVTATGLPKPTAHRLATALVSHGLIRRDEDGTHRPGPKLVGLGRRAAASWPIAAVARPVLGELRDETGESVQLYVRDGDARICLVSLDSAHELRTIVAEGSRLPLAVGSAGRILADPAPAADRGDGSGPSSSTGSEAASESASVAAGGLGPTRWVSSVEERAPGVASVSAPVTVDGVVIAAIGVSGPVGRLGADPGAVHGEAVVAAAERIAARAR